MESKRRAGDPRRNASREGRHVWDAEWEELERRGDGSMDERKEHLWRADNVLATTSRRHRTVRGSAWLQQDMVSGSTRPEADSFENDDIAVSEKENDESNPQLQGNVQSEPHQLGEVEPGPNDHNVVNVFNQLIDDSEIGRAAVANIREVPSSSTRNHLTDSELRGSHDAQQDDKEVAVKKADYARAIKKADYT